MNADANFGGAPAPDIEPKLTWKETHRRLRADKAAFCRYLGFETAGRPGIPMFHPSYQCVFLYRVSRFCFVHGHIYLARFFWHLNLLLTGADIPPISDIGEGFCVVHTAGCIVVGKAGKNLLLHGVCGMGGGRSAADIGAGPGLPIIGDDVEVEFGGGILGGVRVGNGVRIGQRALVTRDVPDGMDVSFAPSLKRRATLAMLSEKPDASD